MKAPNYNGNPMVIVDINTEEKNTHTIKGRDGDIKIYMDTRSTPDGRVSRPTSGIMVSEDKDIPVGSYIMFHHNACMESQRIIMDCNPNIRRYVIMKMAIYYWVDKEGEIHTMYPYCIGRRIYYPPEERNGIIIRANKEKIKDHILLEKVPENEYGVKAGDVAVMIPKSDYEVNYTNNERRVQTIRINIEEDILGIDNDFKKRSNFVL